MKVTSTETPIRERGATIDTRLRLDPGHRPSALPHAPQLETLVELASRVTTTTGDRHDLVGRQGFTEHPIQIFENNFPANWKEEVSSLSIPRNFQSP